MHLSAFTSVAQCVSFSRFIKIPQLPLNWSHNCYQATHHPRSLPFLSQGLSVKDKTKTNRKTGTRSHTHVHTDTGVGTFTKMKTAIDYFAKAEEASEPSIWCTIELY